jgi:putative acetyltransferase
MSATIGFETANQPDVIALIDALDAYQMPLYPPESHHGIDINALTQPNVIFAVARDAGRNAVACGAMVIEPTFAEIKRMFVRPEARGQGLARKLLQALEAEAQSRGAHTFALETGHLQHEAIALYERMGYGRTGPFGDYQPDPLSVFMQKKVGGASV